MNHEIRWNQEYCDTPETERREQTGNTKQT
jgi:hypothetical protein